MPWLVASAALEFVYFFTLTAAYQRSELSLVYPLARGGAPVLVLLGALATGVVPTGWETAGVLAVAAGVVLVRGIRGGDRLGVLLGLADRGPDRRLHARRRRGDPSTRTRCRTCCSCSCRPPWARRSSCGRERLRRGGEPSERVLAGCGGFLAYVLVLAALQLAPAAPVAAVRETSVLFAVALAAPVLGERVTRGQARGRGARRRRNRRARAGLSSSRDRPNGLPLATLPRTIFTCWTKWARCAHFC